MTSLLREEEVEDESSLDDSLLLRPEYLDNYIGQDKLKDLLLVSIKAAKLREESLDHILLQGPPGLGKTTLAQIIANEMGGNLKILSGPSLEKRGDIASALSALEPGDILFIDEIHRIPKVLSEILYSAMEDFVLDVIIGDKDSSRSIRIDLPPFTLIGATTRVGDLMAPLRARFGSVYRLDYYTLKNLKDIARRTSLVYDIKITDEAALELAKRSRGTPRILNRLFRRVRDFATLYNNNLIDVNVTKEALHLLDIDELGLDKIDHRYLNTVILKFNGGPVGIDTISKCLNEDSVTIEDVYEPFLIQEGFIERTLRGRLATKKAYEHLNIPYTKAEKK